jgi:hypothetical protein
MRNFKFALIFAIAAIASIIIYSCSKDDSKLKSERASIIETRSTSNLVCGINFPNNTNFANVGNILHWKLPTGYTAVGVTSSGQYFRALEGDITCTCKKENGGCSPGTVNGKVACVMTSCSECSKTETLTGISEELVEIIVINELDLKLITKIDDLKNKKLFGQRFANLPEFKTVISEISTLLKTYPTQESTKTIFAEIYGQIVTLEVPIGFEDIAVSVPITGAPGGGIKCSCLVGESCPADGVWPAKWCDASNCKSCKMSGASVVDKDGLQQQIAIDDNNFIRF